MEGTQNNTRSQIFYLGNVSHRGLWERGISTATLAHNSTAHLTIPWNLNWKLRNKKENLPVLKGGTRLEKEMVKETGGHRFKNSSVNQSELYNIYVPT